MKKRAMKKWIPKNECYCYNLVKKKGKVKIEVCKWYRLSEKHGEQENGYCLYLKKGDWESEGVSLLFDLVKECGEKDK